MWLPGSPSGPQYVPTVCDLKSSLDDEAQALSVAPLSLDATSHNSGETIFRRPTPSDAYYSNQRQHVPSSSFAKSDDSMRNVIRYVDSTSENVVKMESSIPTSQLVHSSRDIESSTELLYNVKIEPYLTEQQPSQENSILTVLNKPPDSVRDSGNIPNAAEESMAVDEPDSLGIAVGETHQSYSRDALIQQLIAITAECDKRCAESGCCRVSAYGNSAESIKLGEGGETKENEIKPKQDEERRTARRRRLIELGNLLVTHRQASEDPQALLPTTLGNRRQLFHPVSTGVEGFSIAAGPGSSYVVSSPGMPGRPSGSPFMPSHTSTGSPMAVPVRFSPHGTVHQLQMQPSGPFTQAYATHPEQRRLISEHQRNGFSDTKPYHQSLLYPRQTICRPTTISNSQNVALQLPQFRSNSVEEFQQPVHHVRNSQLPGNTLMPDMPKQPFLTPQAKPFQHFQQSSYSRIPPSMGMIGQGISLAEANNCPAAGIVHPSQLPQI